MYSSALWPESTGGVRGDLAVDGDSDSEKSLEEAQLHKIHTILRKARVKAGDRVLEFGSGWGAMSIEVRIKPTELQIRKPDARTLTYKGGQAWRHCRYHHSFCRAEEVG